MTINDERRQVAIAAELAETARTLAHSTRNIPRPSDSYALLGNLVAAQRSIAQVYEQLAAWHGQVIEGIHHDGEEPSDVVRLHGRGTAGARAALLEAKEHAELVEHHLMAAHSSNGMIRWFDDTDPGPRAS